MTAFTTGNIILGGAGSDFMVGRAGDDLLDGDAWLNVRISVRRNLDGTGPEIATYDSMTPMIPFMLDRTYNPGQLVIVREIKYSTSAGLRYRGVHRQLGRLQHPSFDFGSYGFDEVRVRPRWDRWHRYAEAYRAAAVRRSVSRSERPDSTRRLPRTTLPRCAHDQRHDAGRAPTADGVDCRCDGCRQRELDESDRSDPRTGRLFLAGGSEPGRLYGYHVRRRGRVVACRRCDLCTSGCRASVSRCGSVPSTRTTKACWKKSTPLLLPRSKSTSHL